jgi:hypothetical protein
MFSRKNYTHVDFGEGKKNTRRIRYVDPHMLGCRFLHTFSFHSSLSFLHKFGAPNRAHYLQILAHIWPPRGNKHRLLPGVSFFPSPTTSLSLFQGQYLTEDIK